jgi:RNA polymerase sigma factor (sigma-70 family)
MDTFSILVKAAQNGDAEAFEKIVERCKDMANACAYSMLNDAQLAEDVAQEAFIEAYLELPKLREPAAFPGWFRRIVFKQYDRLTRGKHIPTIPLEFAYDVPLTDSNVITFIEERERDELVRRSIQDLPENERIVTLLFYSTGYSLKDIAEFLEVPVTTIKMRLHDARKHLKVSLLETVRDSLHEQRQTMLDQNPMPVNVKMEKESRAQPNAWIGNGLNRSAILRHV